MSAKRRKKFISITNKLNAKTLYFDRTWYVANLWMFRKNVYDYYEIVKLYLTKVIIDDISALNYFTMLWNERLTEICEIF